MRCLLAALTSLALLTGPRSSLAQEAAVWPGFLGPARNGLSSETGLNLDWQKKPPRVLWRVPLGQGFSSCAIVGDRLYTTAERQGRQLALCLSTSDGKTIWTRDLAGSYRDFQGQGYGPRATPTYENGRLYCLLPMGQLFCLQAADGSILWQTDGLKATGAEDRSREKYYWGLSGSPLLEGNLAIIHLGGTRNNSVAAFHKDSGKLAWTTGDDPPGYGSPIAITVDGQRMVVVTTAASLLGIEPTQGKVLWRYEFGNEWNCTCATPQWTGDRLIISAAYETGAAAIQPVRQNNGWEVRELWRHKNFQTQFGTAMLHEGHLYGTHGTFSGFTLRCLEVQTGQVKWQERFGKSSLVQAQGHLFCLEEQGTLQLVQAHPERYILKGVVPGLLGKKAWAAPALANRRLYIRDQKDLVCLDVSR